MSARSLCRNFFKNILEPLHLYRQKALIEATSAVINGASLTLTHVQIAHSDNQSHRRDFPERFQLHNFIKRRKRHIHALRH